MVSSDIKTTLCAMLVDKKHRKAVRLRQAAMAIGIRALQSGNRAKAVKYLALCERISGMISADGAFETLTEKIVTTV
ncbi:hypothetical protein FACS1894216_01940 [Synergistales bacterium]|nr:hypothetical protein FACS1894216_01940 [Synergistales bacterium]